jgi:hypothetical protein
MTPRPARPPSPPPVLCKMRHVCTHPSVEEEQASSNATYAEYSYRRARAIRRRCRKQESREGWGRTCYTDKHPADPNFKFRSAIPFSSNEPCPGQRRVPLVHMANRHGVNPVMAGNGLGHSLQICPKLVGPFLVMLSSGGRPVRARSKVDSSGRHAVNVAY